MNEIYRTKIRTKSIVLRRTELSEGKILESSLRDWVLQSV